MPPFKHLPSGLRAKRLLRSSSLAVDVVSQLLLILVEVVEMADAVDVVTIRSQSSVVTM